MTYTMRHTEKMTFEALYHWEYPIYNGLLYDDSVTSDMIENSFTYPNFDLIDVNLDWQDDLILHNDHNLSDAMKHAIRIAKIIDDLISGRGKIINPIIIDTLCQQSYSCIPDGHHRLRALQELNYKDFPVQLTGGVDELNDLIRLNIKAIKRSKKG